MEKFGPLIMVFDGVFLSEGFDEATEGAEATVASGVALEHFQASVFSRRAVLCSPTKR